MISEKSKERRVVTGIPCADLYNFELNVSVGHDAFTGSIGFNLVWMVQLQMGL